jgi:hypothetical protein
MPYHPKYPNDWIPCDETQPDHQVEAYSVSVYCDRYIYLQQVPCLRLQSVFRCIEAEVSLCTVRKTIILMFPRLQKENTDMKLTSQLKICILTEVIIRIDYDALGTCPYMLHPPFLWPTKSFHTNSISSYLIEYFVIFPL